MSKNQDQEVNKNSLIQSTIFNRLKKCLLGIPIVLLVSCTNAGDNTQGTQEPSKNANTNVVKVLNRVACIENVQGCNQADFDFLWKSCLTDGFVTTLPSNQVTSSRDIKELTKNSYSVNTNTPKEITDENGIVHQSDEEVVTTQKEVNFTGYCIGSEYVVRK